MMRWLGGSGRPQREPEVYSSVASGLQELYKKHLLQLEKDFKFNQFYSPLLSDGDFTAKPSVLLIGQYSTGKTTFIQHLLERDYPGCRIGPEPTTDNFTAVMYGENDQMIPGNAAVVDKSKPWSQLAEFGNAFLSRFSCAEVNSPMLKGITLIDTPGVLSGNKQSERGYNFEGVIKWFAERVDKIILMFDSHKLDISDEFRRCIHSLKGYDSKIRIVLNKADSVSPQQLMRVYGALMWSLGKVIETPEVTRVYIGSFWDAPLKINEYRKLFEAEASDLYADIASLPKYAAIRKMNDFIKRCRLAKVHALVLTYMKKQMPMFGKTSKQKELTKNLETSVFPIVSREYDLPLGDFPSAELLRERLPTIELAKLPKLDMRRIQAIDDLLSRSIPTLMKLIPQEERAAVESAPTDGQMVNQQPSPFLSLGANAINANTPSWAVKKYLQTPPNIDLYRGDFMGVGPDLQGLVTGAQVKPDLVRVSGLPSSVLHRIWNLSDINKDGSLDLYEYSIARHFIDMKLQGFELPHTIPDELLAPVRTNGSYSTGAHLNDTFPSTRYTATSIATEATSNNAFYESSPPESFFEGSTSPIPSPDRLTFNSFTKAESCGALGTPGVARDQSSTRTLRNVNDPFEVQRSNTQQNSSQREGPPYEAASTTEGFSTLHHHNNHVHNTNAHRVDHGSNTLLEDEDDLQSTMTEEILFNAKRRSINGEESNKSVFAVDE